MTVPGPTRVGEGRDITVKGRKHTPEQIVRKLGEADRLLGEGRTTAWR